MEGASSERKEKRHESNSVTNSTPLELLFDSALCATDQSESYIHFQPQAKEYQAKDTLLSVVKHHLWRNHCDQRFTENSNAKFYLSQQKSLLPIDHGKLVGEAARYQKVSLCSPHPEQHSANFSSISESHDSSISSGGRPSRIKNRIKWTVDLHEKFVNCVNLLGGAEKATPRAILKLMKSNGLTILHVKSHLQKYRYAKCSTGASTSEKPDQRVHDDIDDLPMLYFKSGMQVKEILEMQLEVQRRLCKQVEIQQNLQQAIEEQGKQIKMMHEQLKKTEKAS